MGYGPILLHCLTKPWINDKTVDYWQDWQNGDGPGDNTASFLLIGSGFVIKPVLNR